jgi:hypothetical protein
MNRPQPLSRSHNRKVELVFLAFALAAPSCTLYVMAQGCDLLHGIGWVALELARPVISAALRCVPAHLCGCSGFAQHLLQIVASDWPLLWS